MSFQMQIEERRKVEKLHEAEALDYNKRLAVMAQEGETRAREQNILEKVQHLIENLEYIWWTFLALQKLTQMERDRFLDYLEMERGARHLSEEEENVKMKALAAEREGELRRNREKMIEKKNQMRKVCWSHSVFFQRFILFASIRRTTKYWSSRLMKTVSEN